jgi:CheY-like chemotaxis protein
MEQMMRLLVVEDMLEFRKKFIKVVLQRSPTWEYDFAESVEEAWSFLCQRLYNALYVDVMLKTSSFPIQQRSEGLHLVHWLRAGANGNARPLRGDALPTNLTAPVLLVTFRSIARVKKEMATLGLEETSGIRLIPRLLIKEHRQYDIITQMCRTRG